ncbi:MAG TPA: S49 family peptidase, partial [Candidatus Cloacimonadota bacterium]|nr:S49 family peptidase [Candidatus Cloacimonadota bacterium]
MQLVWQEFPIAGVDNLFIPYSNPSLLGTGNANGLGIVNLADEERFQKHYWLILNTDVLSYAYERDHSVQHHMLATGNQLLPAHIFPNLYFGSNYRWKSDAFKKGVFRSGFTYRPHDSSSLAFTWDNPINDKPFYRAGIALRPLAFVKSLEDYRLELSADINYSYLLQGDKYEFSKPIIGFNTQLIDGVKIGATYNLEEETALVSFSLSARKAEIGGLMRMEEDNNWGYSYVHLADESFKPFLGLGPKAWYQMKPKGQIVSYNGPKYTLGPVKIFDSKTHSIDSVISEIKKAAEDPAVRGLLFKDPSFATSFALQQELVDALREFKTTGKSISFYYNNISNGAYIFAASIADQIYLNPNGTVDLRGLSITSPYFKDLLKTLGIEPMNFRSHRYKNAGNMFSEPEMTAAEREVYDSLLQSIYDQMIAQINVGRGDRMNKPVEAIIDAGPYFISAQALQAGLVDKLIYEDELSTTLKKDFQFSARTNELSDYRSYDWSKPKETLIATIYASGNIIMGEGTPGQKIAHETTVELIRAARKNHMYTGILLRVDSGGGSAQASD